MASEGRSVQGSPALRGDVITDILDGRPLLPRPFARFVGFSALPCWFVSILAGSFVRGGVVASGMSALVPVCLGAALAALVVLVLTLRVIPLSRRRAGLLGAGALAALGSTALTLMPAGLGVWVLWAGTLVAGAGVMWLALAWQEFFATQGVRAALLGMAACCGLGIVAFSALCLLPAPIARAAATLLPLVGALTLWPPRGTRFYASGPDSISTARLLSNIANDYSPRMFVLCALAAFAAVCGCAPLAGVLLQGAGAPSISWDVTGAAGLAGAFTCALIAFERPRRIMRLFYATLPLLVAAALAAFAALGVDAGAAMSWDDALGLRTGRILASVALNLGGMGLCGTFCLIWALMVDCSHRKRLPALGLVASLGSACFAGVALGLVVAALAGSVPVRCVVISLAATAVACLLFASFNGRVAVSEESFAAPQRTSQERSVLALAERARLTPRETEVLQVWLAGHNAAYIEEALHISRNTVKTHLNHIYQKTGASGREELLAMLDGPAAH